MKADLTLAAEGPRPWNFDAVGDCTCQPRLTTRADLLAIVSRLVIERYPAPLKAAAPGA